MHHNSQESCLEKRKEDLADRVISWASRKIRELVDFNLLGLIQSQFALSLLKL